MEYLGGTAFTDRQGFTNDYLRDHEELSLSSQRTISPRIFRNLVDEQLEPLIECRTYLVQELSRIWGMYWEQINTPENEATKRELQQMSDTGTLSKNKYQVLLKDVVKIVTACAPRVNWKKHGKKRYQRELAEWIQQKHVHLAGLVEKVHNYGIKSELEAVRDTIAHAATILPPPSDELSHETSTTNGAITAGGQNERSATGKRTFDDDDDALPPSKKLKQQLPPGQWWGPNNSRLSCDDAFFDVIRQYKAYLANPSEEPGTEAHRAKMTGFLRQALDRAGLRSRVDDVLLKSEWDFRDPATGHVRVPSFIQPGASESEGRLGGAGARGSNDFKTMLGGGLTAAETSFRNQVPPAFQGMVALAHSARSFRSDNLSLRGGNSDDVDDDDGDNNDNDDDEVETNTRIRRGTRLPFRDPGDLWEQFLEDAKYPPGVFKRRVEAARPPMMDPDRGGTTMKKYQAAMSSIPLLDEWDAVQQEQDTDVLDKKAAEYLTALTESRRSVHRFIHRRPENIFLDEPSLNQPGGRDKPGSRYKRIQSREFVEPISHAFEARMYQVLRLAIYWRFYQMGLITLQGLLSEEKLHLEIWDQHEEAYMEWENQRFFTLKSDYEISELGNRYNARELLRKAWESERGEIDKAMKLLDEDPHHYDNPAPSPKAPTPQPEEEPALPDPSSQPQKRSGSSIGNTPQAGPSVRATSKSQKGVRRQPIFDSAKPSGQKAGTVETQTAYDTGNDNIFDDDAGAVQDPTDNNGANTYSDARPPGTKANVASSSTKNPGTANGADMAIEICEKIRDAYENKLEEALRQNNDLDVYDPGNQAIINRNNIDVMAKKQTIWGLDTEIHNLRRSVDPLAADSYGKGAAHKWELPAEEDLWKHTRQIPPKPELPLGVTSLGLGPMPGEHPSVGDPRVFFGAHSSFGRTPSPHEEMRRDAAGDNLFAGVSRPQASGARTKVAPVSSMAGLEVPSQIDDHIPKDWAGFIALHQESMGAPEPTGTAALGWNDWTESLYQALLSGTRNLRGNFPDGSPFKGTDEDLRRHIQAVYRRAFGSLANHNSWDWEYREKHRHLILSDFADVVNKALRDKGLQETFPRPGKTGSPTAAVAAQAIGSQDNAVLNELRDCLKKKNQAKAAVRHLTRIQKSHPGGLSAQQQQTLDHVKKSRRKYKARYKRLRAEADPATRAQADRAERDEKNRINTLYAREAADEDGEEAAAQEWGQPAATDEDDMEGVEFAKTELQKAEEKVEETTAVFEAAQEKVNKAASDAAKAQAAAATTRDSYLQKLSVVTAQAKDEADEEFHDAVVSLRLAGEALLAQRAWEAPAETPQELRSRFAALTPSLDVWANGYQWDTWVLNGRNAVDQWIIDVVSLVHEAYKAIGVTVTVQHWYDLYEDFWRTQGTSLVRMRAIWLFSLIVILNQNIELTGGDILIPTPTQPPIEWKGNPPPRAALLREADAELAQRPFVKSVPFPKSPAVTTLKADLPAEPTSPRKVVPDPNPSPNPSLNPKPVTQQYQHQYHHQVKQQTAQPNAKSKNKPGSTLLERRRRPAISIDDSNNNNKDDAWPDLKDLLKAAWGSLVAHEALHQQPGDRAGVRPGRPLWPAPVRVQVNGPDPHEYYSL